MTQKRTILLIGKTGNGKSTLANVLSNTEEFEEGDGLESQTKRFKSLNFKDEERDIEYTIVDTPGISDTDPENEREVYHEIVKAVYFTEKKLNQILFVTKGRFTKEEERAYELLWDAFFNEEVIKHTTIVRTNFPKFNNLEVCKKDIERTTGKVAEIIKNCNGRVIHVENYPDDDKKREMSRDILLRHLENCGDVYNHKLPNISDAEIQMIEKLKEELGDVRKRIKRSSETIDCVNNFADAVKKVKRIVGSSLSGLYDMVSYDISKKQIRYEGITTGIKETTEPNSSSSFSWFLWLVGKDPTMAVVAEGVADLTKATTRIVEDHLVNKFRRNFEEITEKAKDFFSKMETLEKEKNLKELEKLYARHIIELGERMRYLEIKLEITQLFNEEQRFQQQAQVQIPSQ